VFERKPLLLVAKDLGPDEKTRIERTALVPSQGMKLSEQ
jgi:hypothetical protein